jgi:hypothetical protein
VGVWRSHMKKHLEQSFEAKLREEGICDTHIITQEMTNYASPIKLRSQTLIRKPNKKDDEETKEDTTTLLAKKKKQKKSPNKVRGTKRVSDIPCSFFAALLATHWKSSLWDLYTFSQISGYGRFGWKTR